MRVQRIDERIYVDPVLLQHAEQVCKRRLESDPNDCKAMRSLADVYRKQGRLQESLAVYERLCVLVPQDQKATYERAVIIGKELPEAPSGFRAAPFVLFRDFLPPDIHSKLIPFVHSAQDQFFHGKIFVQGAKAYTPGVREVLAFQGRWEGENQFLRKVKEVLPQILGRLGVAPFEIGVVDMELRAYQDQHYFKVHMDAPPGSARASRIVSFVYYFHRLPKPYTGGELLLFDSDIEANNFTGTRFTRVVPEDNSVIFFRSCFFHCVTPINCPSKEFADSRFAVGGFISRRLPESGAVNNQ
jgi:Rps23 Pro-64 3,4-dihydroxylase Tpa1-like proline 4-hydroxylase